MNTQKSLKSSLALKTSGDGGLVVTLVAVINAERRQAEAALAIAIQLVLQIKSNGMYLSPCLSNLLHYAGLHYAPYVQSDLVAYAY